MFSFQFKRIRGPQKCGGPRVAGSRRICGNGFVSERRRKKKEDTRKGKPMETAATMEKSKTLCCFFPQLLG